MKIAITGGTGFVGRNAAAELKARGHETVLISRLRKGAYSTTFSIGLDDVAGLTLAFAGCDAVVHCAGINREIGEQTYQRVHINGTRHVVEAAQQAGVKKIVMISFLRARPNCGSGYHESKWGAEEIVRASGLDYTILRCGVIYGKGDHMLDHLSHAFYTFPIFALVGFSDKPIRPNAVEDVARIIVAAVADGALPRTTAPVVGPDLLTLSQAVRRVAHVVGRCPLMFPMPIWFHYLLGWCLEKVMTIPLISLAQVRILSEGLAEAALPCDPLPANLAPKIRFDDEQIARGLPAPARFGCHDLLPARRWRSKRVFFKMP
jgi:NADH dehydrogenase